MNWGWKLAIGSALFMSMIIYFVVQSFTTSTKTMLVSDNYYEDELKFQEIIDAKKNATLLDDTLFVTQPNSDVIIDYPALFSNNICEGIIHFYKPSNENHDKKIEFAQRGGQQIIPRAQLAPGNYQVKIDLTVAKKDYHYEKPLEVK